MSGISMLTALIIQNNGDNILCSSGQDEKSKKWHGFIYLKKGGAVHTELISTDPAFETQETAESAMKALVDEIRRTVSSKEIDSASKEKISVHATQSE